MSNVVKAVFGSLKVAETAPLWQYDYGQILQIIGLDLPETYEVHFSNSERGAAKTAIGGPDGVMIPDEYLTSGEKIFAWIFLHTGADDGETRYKITIPVRRRASISDAPPTPQQQEAITQAIAALTGAVEDAEAIADGIRNMTAEAEDLPTGSSATASWDGDTNTLTFGIPAGQTGPTGDSGVYIGETEPTDPDVNVWIDPSGEAAISAGDVAYDPADTYASGTVGGAIGDLSELDTTAKSNLVDAINETLAAGSPTAQQIQDAVDDYLADHAVYTGMFTNAAKTALLNLLEKVAYVEANGDELMETLRTELFRLNVESIDAVFTQGAAVVYATDPLDSLREYLVVTATYSDSTVAETDLYTLSGTLSVGTSTVTVSYGGKTDTFTVTVTEPTPVFQLAEATSTNNYDTEIELFDTPKSFTILCEFTFNNYNWSGTKSLFGHAAFRFGYTGAITDYIDGSVNEKNATRYGALLLYPPGTSPALGTWVVSRTNGSQTRRFAIRYDCTTRKIECFVDGDDDRDPPNTKSWYIVPSEVIQPSGTTVLLNKDSSGSTANKFEIYLGLLSDSAINSYLAGGGE